MRGMGSVKSVLLITGQFPPAAGGGGQVVYNLSKGLASIGKEVRVFVSGKPESPAKSGSSAETKIDSDLKRKGVSVFRAKGSLDVNALNLESVTSQLLYKITGENVDVIHAHHTGSIYLGSIIKAAYPETALVASLHKTPIHNFDKSLIRGDPHYAIYNHLMKLNVDLWIAYSKLFRKEWINGLGLNRQKVEVIYPGIDLQSSRSDSSPKSTIFCPGRLDRRKAYEKLIEEVAEYNAAMQEHKLKIVYTGTAEKEKNGEKEYKKQLVRLAQEKKVEINFKPYGFDGIKKAYKDKLTCVVPSENEGLGLVILESMSCGTPVIISSSIGNEVVKSEENGLFFNPEVRGNLARALMRLHSDNLRERLVKNGIITVKRDFDPILSAKRHLKAYERAYSFINKQETRAH